MFRNKIQDSIKFYSSLYEDLKLEQNELLELFMTLREQLIEEFYYYILNHKTLSKYISREQIPYLVKRQFDFIESWFLKDIDDSLVKDLEKVVQVHSKIGLSLEEMLYGIDLLQDIISKRIISTKTIDDVKKYSFLKYVRMRMSLLRLASFEFYANSMRIGDTNFIIQELYSNHMMNMNKIYLAFNKNQLTDLDIVEDYKSCKVQNYIEELKLLNDELGNALEEIHKRWHEAFKALKNTRNENLLKVISSITEEFLDYLVKDSYSNELDLEALKLFLKLLDEERYVIVENDVEKYILSKVTFYGEFFKEMFNMIVVYSDYEDLFKDYFDYVYRLELNTDKNFYIAFKIKNRFKMNPEPIRSIYLRFFEILAKLIAKFLEKDVNNVLYSIENKQLAVEAQASLKAKNIFLANMSHELRTPLNAIIGFAQILSLRKDIPENLRPYVEKINIAGKHLLETINAVLDFSKLEAGKVSLNLQDSSLEELIKEVKTILEPLAQKKSINLNIELINNSDKDKFLFDFQLIKQVLLNLGSNAIKFTKEGGYVNIKIEVSQENIRFSVCDSGIGIAKEDIVKLFKPFSQIANELQSSTKGTGLGLVISQKIVELHGGRIWVESELGKGTCFFFEIPTRNKEEDIFRYPKKDAKRILILEDNKDYMDYLKDCLKDFDLTITPKVSIAQELVEKEKFDFAIIDFFLKDKIAMEFIKNMNPPFLIVSADTDLIPIKEMPKISKSELDCEKLIDYIKEILKEET